MVFSFIQPDEEATKHKKKKRKCEKKSSEQDENRLFHAWWEIS